jgi:RNA polymerase sigma-70 factor (ECF subfamily)
VQGSAAATRSHPGESAIDPSAAFAPAGDDRAIVEAILGGRRDAYRIIVERDGPTLVRACHRILGDLHEAEDAAQEAFVIGFRSLSTWRGEGPLAAWLSRIAVRIALRKAKATKSVTWLETAPDDIRGELVSSLPDPGALAIQAERSAAVRAAVAGLDEPYREVVALRFFAERSLAEIAEQTGRPLGTVKTHLHRGLLRLRDRLGSEA